MRNTLAIMQRELLSLFCAPLGYVVIAGFLLLTGVITLMTGSFAPGQPASLRDIFSFMPYVLAFIVPAICMRSISEEYRSGTFETLMTASVTDGQLVVGKFLAALVFYGIMLAGTLLYLVLMMIYGNPDLGAAAAAYLGMLLIGAAFTAFGVLTSSLTRDQMAAWMLATVPLMLFVWFGSYISEQATGDLRYFLQQINIQGHVLKFNQGLVTAEAVTLFLAGTALFLFLSVKIVESRRWR